MKPSFASQRNPQAPQLRTEQDRKRLITAALRLLAGTWLGPQLYERMLLDQFVRGNLTLDDVLARLQTHEHK